jgi:hypothetical protein
MFDMIHTTPQSTSGRNRASATLPALKIAGTWSLCGLVFLMWSRPAGKAALAGYADAIGYLGLAAIFAGFLAVVALYCRTIERCLSLVDPQRRVAEPKSVWMMFLIPYNFIEDFFIVINVAGSLRREASANPQLQKFRGFGIWSGTGWCTAQLVSLVPGPAGEAAGLIAGILWVLHWRFIAKVNRLLARRDQPCVR